MIFGLDFSLTSSPTAGMTGSRMMTSLEVQIRAAERISWQFDVPTAYLWTTDRLHRGFMLPQKGFEQAGEEGTYEMGKNLSFSDGIPPHIPPCARGVVHGNGWSHTVFGFSPA